MSFQPYYHRIQGCRVDAQATYPSGIVIYGTRKWGKMYWTGNLGDTWTQSPGSAYMQAVTARTNARLAAQGLPPMEIVTEIPAHPKQ